MRIYEKIRSFIGGNFVGSRSDVLSVPAGSECAKCWVLDVSVFGIPDFPDSVSGVLSQDGQYPWGVSYYSEEYIYDPYFYEIAENLLAGNTPLPENVVYQARFPQGSGTYCTLGAHYYCYK